jgi:hypothetical protein
MLVWTVQLFSCTKALTSFLSISGDSERTVSRFAWSDNLYNWLTGGCATVALWRADSADCPADEWHVESSITSGSRGGAAVLSHRALVLLRCVSSIHRWSTPSRSTGATRRARRQLTCVQVSAMRGSSVGWNQTGGQTSERTTRTSVHSGSASGE